MCIRDRCNILLAFNTNLEDSKLNPEENNSIESSPNLNENNKDLIEGSSLHAFLVFASNICTKKKLP